MKTKEPEIILIGPSYPFRGGIAHYTTLLYENLKKRCTIEFHSFKRQYFNFLFPGVTDRDNSIFQIKNDDIFRDLDNFNPFTWIKAGFLARRFDLILLPWWVVFWAPYYIILLLIGKMKNNRVIFLCHNVVEHEESPLKHLLSGLALRLGDGFVVHSDEEKIRLFRLLGDNVKTITSPHPTYSVFNRNHFDRSSARAKLNLSKDITVALFFGFIRPYKGVDDMLKAFSIVVNKSKDIILVIVGECWDKNFNLKEKAHKLGIEQYVVFINKYIPNEEVEPFFKACDFLVLPYLSGTGSGVAQIAYSMNIPILATKIGAFQSIVEEDETGKLVPPGDYIALAEAFEKMTNKTLLAKMRERVKEHKKRFEWSYMVDQILHLYETINKNSLEKLL